MTRLLNFDFESTTQVITSDMGRSDRGCKWCTPSCSVNGACSTDTTAIGDNLGCLVASYPRPCKFHTIRHAVHGEVAAQHAVVERRKRIREAEREWVAPATGSRFKVDDHLPMNLLNRRGHPEHLKSAECRCTRGSLAGTDCLHIDYEN